MNTSEREKGQAKVGFNKLESEGDVTISCIYFRLLLPRKFAMCALNTHTQIAREKVAEKGEEQKWNKSVRTCDSGLCKCWFKGENEKGIYAQWKLDYKDGTGKEWNKHKQLTKVLKMTKKINMNIREIDRECANVSVSCVYVRTESKDS